VIGLMLGCVHQLLVLTLIRLSRDLGIATLRSDGAGNVRLTGFSRQVHRL
jgi:hypothetical protein